jgi:hypothetical protein
VLNLSKLYRWSGRNFEKSFPTGGVAQVVEVLSLSSNPSTTERGRERGEGRGMEERGEEERGGQ